MPDRPVESFSRFNYLLRPSKQVERKLFIEALHRLALGSFRIHEYTYLGFGSPYYADFILFHKYLHIDSMVCVERENIPRRMQFNQQKRRVPSLIGACRLIKCTNNRPSLHGDAEKAAGLFIAWRVEAMCVLAIIAIGTGRDAGQGGDLPPTEGGSCGAVLFANRVEKLLAV